MIQRPPAAVRLISDQRLISLDAKIDKAEGDGIEARWKFGRELLAERVGKKLPNGRLAQVAEATGKSRTEIQYRVQFAERYPDEKSLSNAVGQHTSWHTIVNEALPNRPDPAKGKPPEQSTRPVEVKTERQRQVANAAAVYIEKLVGASSAQARAADGMKVDLAAAVRSTEEVEGWVEVIDEQLLALKRLRGRLRATVVSKRGSP